MVDLEVTLGRLRLKNPVLVASGTFGYVREMQGLVHLERLGGVIPKTVTFQIIGTTVDFTAHYVVVGNLTTAVSLSASHLLVRPLYYLVHEAAWNYLGPPAGRKVGLGSNRALAKTVTYQVMATALDFTTHYVVVGSLGTAASLSAIGFVVSPFVYFGHEIAWDYYGSWARRLDPLTRKNLVPEPG